MDIRTSIQAPLTSDHANERVFYMQVDPFSIVPEIPSIFYRKFKHHLRQDMFFVDVKNNVIQVTIGKGPVAGFILAGYETLVRFYGLNRGGWMKVMFVGDDIFAILSVKGSNMARVATPEPPVKLLLSQSPISDVLSSRKPSSHSNQALHENDNGLIEVNRIHVPGVTVRSQAAKECHPPVTQVAPDAGVAANHAVDMTLAAAATKNANFDGVIGFNGSGGTPSGSKACIFCPGVPQCKLADPHKPPIKQSQEKHGNSIKGTPLPPWDLMADLSLFVTCEKEIVGSQNDNSAMVLPSFFYKKAFPTMPKSVLAISELTLPARLGLRWNKHRNYQMFVTKGWKDFAAANGFTDGKLVRFSVPVGDENIMFVYLGKA